MATEVAETPEQCRAVAIDQLRRAICDLQSGDIEHAEHAIACAVAWIHEIGS